MSKTWFPIISYEKCDECGACVDKCEQGVYDKGKWPLPIVVFPDGCTEGCHGCGNLCPNNAISYHDEDSGKVGKGCCCNN